MRSSLQLFKSWWGACNHDRPYAGMIAKILSQGNMSVLRQKHSISEVTFSHESHLRW